MRRVHLALAVLVILALTLAPASADRWAGYEVEIIPGPDGYASGTFTIFGEGEYGLVDLEGSWMVTREQGQPPILNIEVAGIVERADGEVIEIDHQFSIQGNGQNIGVCIKQIIAWVESILER